MKIRSISVSLLAMLLALPMFIPILISCDPATGDETAITTVPDSAAQTTERPWLDDLPDKKFNGKEFTVYGDISQWADPGSPDVARVDVISAANYDRYHNVQERFDMVFRYVEPTVDVEKLSKAATGLRHYVDSGTYDFDLINGVDVYLAGLAFEGYVIDLAACDEFTANIDLSQPWWSEEYTKALSLGPYRFWIYGASDAAIYQALFSIVFNKEFADLYLDTEAGETMYDFVYNGTWTLDKMYQFEKLAYIDDGNSIRDENDRYGFALVSGNFLDKLAIASLPTFTARDEENIPYANLNSERNVAINEKLYDIAYNNGYANTFESDNSAPFVSFQNGQIMMYMTYLGDTLNFRQVQWDFGILPLPKFDEYQEEYYGSQRYGALLDGIPVIVPESEYDFIFTILEGNSSEVWRITRPAFLDEGLKNKYSRDEDTKNMVDLTQNHTMIDFLIIYSADNSGYDHFFKDNIASGMRDISSKIARKDKSINKQIEGWFDKFEEHSGQ